MTGNRLRFPEKYEWEIYHFVFVENSSDLWGVKASQVRA